MSSRGDIDYNNVQPELHSSWLQLQFDEVLDKTGAFTKLKATECLKEGTYPVIDQGEKYISGYVDNRDLIYQGEIPVIIFGDHTRIVKFVDFEFAAGADGTKILKPFKFLEPKFFFYYLKSLKVPSLGYSRHFSILKSIKVPVPPISEQKLIVAKLDKAFEHLDTLKAKLDRIPELLKNFRQAVLTQAVTGKLTSYNNFDTSYFESIEARYSNNQKVSRLSEGEISFATKIYQGLSNNWRFYPLELLVDSEKGIPYGIVQTGENIAGGIPTIRCGDIKALGIKNDLKMVDPEIEKNYSRTRLNGGEVLLSIRGTVGNAAVVPNKFKNYNISREVALIPIIGKIDSNFIALLLQSPVGYNLLNDKVKGIAQRGINLLDLKRLVVQLPHIDEQQDIVKKVEALFAKADAIEAYYTLLKEKINNLPQALLAKAFRGELVPQDPNDEPASVLLERIKAGKNGEAKISKGKKAKASNQIELTI